MLVNAYPLEGRAAPPPTPRLMPLPVVRETKARVVIGKTPFLDGKNLATVAKSFLQINVENGV